MSNADRTLGMDTCITRRDFLNSSLLASGALLSLQLAPREALASRANKHGAKPADNGLGWAGYSGEGDYKDANGNTEPVVQAAHTLREGLYDRIPNDLIDTGENYDLVIVGGGIAGLSAALFARARSNRPLSILILENHSIFGGEARHNQFIVDGVRLEAPQGSNSFRAQRPGNLVDRTYKMIGLDWREFVYQDWSGPQPELELSRTNYSHLWEMPQSFGFYFGTQFGRHPGTWVVDPWGKRLEECPFPPTMREELLRWRTFRTPPMTPAQQAHLDSITEEQRWSEQAGIGQEAVRRFISPLVAQMVGLGADAVSGLMMYTWRHPMLDDPDPSIPDPDHCFPGGNSGIARHFVKTLIPDAIEGSASMSAIWNGAVRFAALDRPDQAVRIRLAAMVVRVEHDGESAQANQVLVTYVRDGKSFRVRGRSVVMAGGGWAARRAVRDLPTSHHEAYSTFCYSAFLVANVAVRNWRFLHKLGLSGGRWFEGFGHWTEVRTLPKFAASTATVGPDQPTVLTFYVPLMFPGLPTAVQGSRGRAELMSTPYREYERRIREHLTTLFGASGFDARRDIAGIVLNRWGHAFVNPAPGFFVGKDGKPAPRDVLREKPFGRIAFSHGDLSGTVNHMHSIMESSRAANQVLDVLGASKAATG
jgi:spermidine dehydrogenase